MKAKKIKKAGNTEIPSIQYCKNKSCGCELPSNNKGKYCDKCRRERAKKIRETGTTIGGIALAAIALVPGLKEIGKFTKK